MRAMRSIMTSAIVAGMTAFAIAPTQAEVVWNWTNEGTTYNIVQADPFYDGGTKGNTEALADDYGNGPDTYWAALDDAPSYKWNFRSAFAYNFNVLGGQDVDDPDIFECVVGSGGYTDKVKAPDLRTTIDGLTQGAYDVYLVAAFRNDANQENMQWLRGDIDIDQEAATTPHKRTQEGIVWTGYQGAGGNSVFEIALVPLGEVTGTEFSVLVGRGVSGQIANPERVHYLGVAYVPVPEPGTLALLACGLVGLLAYAWRKRR